MTEINFKPEFGNPEHIRIANTIGLLTKKEKELEKRTDEYMILRSLKKEISDLKKEVKQMLDNQKIKVVLPVVNQK